jgi:hypothetical protein
MRKPPASSRSLLQVVPSFFRHRVFVVALAGGLLAGTLGFTCSNSDGGGSAQIITCREVFTGCPLDPVPSPAQAEECTTILDGPCGNSGLLYRSCVTGACTDAGLTDYAAVSGRCYSAQVAFQSCLDRLDAGAATSSSTGDDIGDTGGTGDTQPDASTTTIPTVTPDASAPADAADGPEAAAPVDAASDAAL